MKLFLFFLVSCLIGGMLLNRLSIARMTWLLVGLCLVTMVGYFFFDMI
ncbi:MAG: hypothetical protein OHK0015_04860 [Chloroflexi bacterium OHK40]